MVPPNEKEEGKLLNKRGRPKDLTDGSLNVLYSRIIDTFLDGGSRQDCFPIVNEHFKRLGHEYPHKQTVWRIINRAKEMWLKSMDVTDLQNYRKEKLFKAERLEDEIRSKSQEDFLHQSKAILDVWRYQDKILEVGKDNGIHIAIDLPSDRSISALEVDDGSDDTKA